MSWSVSVLRFCQQILEYGDDVVYAGEITVFVISPVPWAGVIDGNGVWKLGGLAKVYHPYAGFRLVVYEQ